MRSRKVSVAEREPKCTRMEGENEGHVAASFKAGTDGGKEQTSDAIKDARHAAETTDS